MGNIKTVVSFASEDHEVAGYTLASRDLMHANCVLGWNIGLFQGLSNTSIGAMTLLILYGGGLLVGKGEMSGGDLMAYLVSAGRKTKLTSWKGFYTECPKGSGNGWWAVWTVSQGNRGCVPVA